MPFPSPIRAALTAVLAGTLAFSGTMAADAAPAATRAVVQAGAVAKQFVKAPRPTISFTGPAAFL